MKVESGQHDAFHDFYAEGEGSFKALTPNGIATGGSVAGGEMPSVEGRGGHTPWGTRLPRDYWPNQSAPKPGTSRKRNQNRSGE